MSNVPPTLSRGSNGSDVQRLQGDLTRLGYNPGGIDGDYGDKTEKAVMQFQKDHNLTVDGVVGPQTGRQLGATLAS